MPDSFLYNPTSIADRIKEISKIRKIQIKRMLSDIEIGSNTMSHLRHGRMIASDSLAKIADYLDCSVDYLLGRTDKPEVNK
ncbi:MAG: helix-turn-helix transcriptional regulator [Ruminococcaceae bacterium]|jgi:DNA-binding Xre family transcriptional regulator|nr:helix-turn-helix transcriptional regulator [Oscillospiraceae bacterium]